MQQNQLETEDDQIIAGQITYFNILAQSIQRINDAIMNEKDARDAAENLLTDLPDEWTAEIQEAIDKVTDEYNKLVDSMNQYFKHGVKESLRAEASREIALAGKKYSREIKKIVITLMKKKDLLYQTKKKLERGSISLYELTGEKPPKDDDDD